MRLEFEIEFGLNKRMVVLRITWLELIGMAFVYAELITDGRDIMICPTKRYKFIFDKHEIYEPNWQAAWLFDFLLGWRRPREASCDLGDFPDAPSTKEVMAKFFGN